MSDETRALPRNQILAVDVLAGLRRLPDASIDCVMTSPPYWALRDFGIPPTIWDESSPCEHEWDEWLLDPLADRRSPEEKRASGAQVGNSIASAAFVATNKGRFCRRCRAWQGTLGLEPRIDLFLDHLLIVFDEIRRVLKDEGTCWVNLGDTHGGRWNGSASRDKPDTLGAGLLKSLCLIPERFAIGMLERGWLLRNHIVWYKPNHMPESVRDRFAHSWDHVFFFAKQKRYYFDLDAVRVPHKTQPANKNQDKKRARVPLRESEPRASPEPLPFQAYHPLGRDPGDYWPIPVETRRLGAILSDSGAVKVPGGSGWVGHPDGGAARIAREQDRRWLPEWGKNPGDVWSIATRCFRGAHFAVFPESLVEIPIKAGCPKETCSRCGKARRQVHQRPANPGAFNLTLRDLQLGRTKTPGRHASDEQVRKYDEQRYTSAAREVVIAPGCACEAGYEPGLVLDPFLGSGTTAVVARRLGRDYLGFELNSEYVEMAETRLARIMNNDAG